MFEFFVCFLWCNLVVESELDVLVWVRCLWWLVVFDCQCVSWSQFFGCVVDVMRVGDIIEGEIFFNCVWIDLFFECWMSCYNFEFGFEDQCVVVQLGIKKRFDFYVIVGEEECLLIFVLQYEGEYVVELFDIGFVLGFLGMDDDFGIVVGMEYVIKSLKFWY